MKYYNKNDAQHLINTPQWFYKVSIDWTGSHYCGFMWKWSYPAGFVDLTMPNYIRNVLNCFQQESTQPTFTPFPIMYSLKQTQYQTAIQNDTSPLLNSTKTKKIQQVIGCLWCYAQSLDNTLLVALNTLSQTQAKPTTKTKQLCSHLLNYFATYPNVGLHYQVSAMILHIDSDASYPIAPEAKIRIAGYFYLKN